MINNTALPVASKVSSKVAPTLGSAALGGLIAGVVTGATVAAATSLRQVKEGEITKQEATSRIMREAGTMGLATTVGVTATAALRLTGVLSIFGVALFTTASKYGIDSMLDKNMLQKDDKTQSASE